MFVVKGKGTASFRKISAVSQKNIPEIWCSARNDLHLPQSLPAGGLEGNLVY